ncbi:MAG: HAMP domain-containing sensor histidine kinase [Planctomycetota bacterium]
MNDAMEHHPDRDPKPSARRGGAAPPPAAAGSVPVADRLTTLAHDLNGLLDGSMRQLTLAQRSLDAEVSTADADDLDSARKHVATAYSALERMCDLLHATLTGSLGAAGSPTITKGAPITLGEAAEHAVSVLAPAAAEVRANLELQIDAEAGVIPAGAIYPLLLNGIRNAIEAIERGGRGGVVRVEVAVEPGDDADGVRIEIVDDGAGVDGELPAGRLFEPGVTSKREGFGLGLAICAEVVSDMGGSIELGPSGSGGGAVLRVRYPVPQDHGSTSIG